MLYDSCLLRGLHVFVSSVLKRIRASVPLCSDLGEYCSEIKHTHFLNYFRILPSILRLV